MNEIIEQMVDEKLVNEEYDGSIGIKRINLAKKEYIIFPIEGDNLRISQIMKNASKNGIDWLYQQFNSLYFIMLTRPATEFESEFGSIRIPIAQQEHQKLKLIIEMNQVKIQKELLKIFGWQTKEQQDKLETMDGEFLKKLINA